MAQLRNKKTEPVDNQAALPLRWVVILALGTAAGVVVGLFGGIAAGLPAGFAATVALHKIVK
jgi:hypothetical protein